MAVGSRIFISYRRTDTSAYAGRLYDQLNATFPGQVFMDVDTLEPGIDFVQRIEESVDSADVLIAVIGRGWASAVDEDGRRRLDQPDDFVRLEVAEALHRAIRVIPVLVGGAAMPEADELPPDLAPLARRNGLTLTDLEWRAGVERLTATIGQVLGAPIGTRDKRRASSTQPLSSAFLPLALGGAVLLAVGLFMPWNQGHTVFAPSFGPAAHARHAGAFTALVPTAIVAAAVLGMLLSRQPRTRALGAGVLFGAGIAGGATYLSILQAIHGAGPGTTIGVLGALAGSVLVVIAALFASRATTETERPPNVRAAITAVAGAVIMIVATGIPFNGGGTSYTSQRVVRSFEEAFDPVLTSVAIAVAGLLLLRRFRHVELSAVLLTLGCLDALLWVRYIGVPLIEDSRVASLGAGGVIGLAGAGLVLLGGYLGLRRSTAPLPESVAVQP